MTEWKTGFIRAAGFCITATAKRDETRLIAVVMGHPSKYGRFNDAEALLNQGFLLFRKVLLVKKGAAIETPVPLRGMSDEIDQAGCRRGCVGEDEPGQSQGRKVQRHAPRECDAARAIRRGTGQLILRLNGEKIGETPLVALGRFQHLWLAAGGKAGRAAGVERPAAAQTRILPVEGTSLCGFLRGCCQPLRSCSRPAAARRLPSVRVITFNIHHAEGDDAKVDLDRIARVALAAKPCIVCLQEVDRHLPRTGNLDFPALLAEKLGMRAIFDANYRFDNGEYGNAISATTRWWRGRTIRCRGRRAWSRAGVWRWPSTWGEATHGAEYAPGAETRRAR